MTQDEIALRLRRRWIWAGRFLGPLLALVVYWILGSASLADGSPLGHRARATAAIGALMASLWLTEALPLPVTALLPLLLFPLAHVLSVREAAAPYASPPIFLFMGGFMVALAMEKWNLHRRIALHILRVSGRGPLGLLAGFTIATAFLSMWISNTATTVMMVPIALAVVHWTAEQLRPRDADRVGETVMLSIAYAASIGGTMTLIGTPPNVLLAAFVRDQYNGTIGFLDWMVFAAPLGITMLALMLVYMWFRLPAGLGGVVRQTRIAVGESLKELGPPSRGEVIVLVVFTCMVVALVGLGTLRHYKPLVEQLPILSRLSDELIVILAAIALFAIPVDITKNVFALDWETAQRLPWGVLLIFGGGLSLARAVTASGFDDWIAQSVAAWHELPDFLFVAAVTAVVVFATELASNTATASAFLPILAAAAKGIGIAPESLLVPATIASSFAFMLPSGTPPNAIVFGTGTVSIQRMARVGLLLNLLAVLLVSITTRVWLPPFGLPQ